MWTSLAGCVALMGCLALTMPGCNRDIAEVQLQAVPDTGCAPLHVELIGAANVKEGLNVQFRWTIAPAITLQGAHVEYTFDTPGRHSITLTVIGEQEQKTKTTMIAVKKVELPPVPGLYVLTTCAYEPLKEIEAEKIVKELGRTTLEDLQQKIVRRPLGTTELLTHPLWRREHTHTVYMVARERFAPLPVEHFNVHGFIAVGEEMQEVALFSIPQAPSALTYDVKVVTKLIDNWGIDNLSSEPHALQKEQIADNTFRYVPETPVSAGLYVLDVKRMGAETSRLSPLALAASNH